MRSDLSPQAGRGKKEALILRRREAPSRRMKPPHRSARAANRMAFYFVQFLTGLASAASLFLMASGLSIIFGVTRIVNFAHGAFYMIGAYVAFTLTERFSGALGFWGGIVAAALIVAVLGVLVEMVLLRRIYHSPELFQLLATFGLTLMVQDLVVLIWGPDDLVGRRAPGFKGAVDFFGQNIPTYDLFLIVLGPVVLGILWLLFQRTRWGILGARRDAGPRHGRSARRQSKVAVHERVCRRRLPRSPGRRVADPARCRASRHGFAHHRRSVRGGRDRRPRQHHRRLCRRGAGVRAQRLRHPDLSEDFDHPRVPRDGRGADRAALGPVRQTRGAGAPLAGADGQSVAADDHERTHRRAGRARRSRHAAIRRRQLCAHRRLGDRDLRDLCRQPAFPDVGRRARFVRPRRLFRPRRLWRGVPRQGGGAADDRLAAARPACSVASVQPYSASSACNCPASISRC